MPLTPQTFTERLMYMTVPISIVHPAGTGNGTGFLYGIEKDGYTSVALVTAKHCLSGANSITLRFHRVQQLPEFRGQLTGAFYEPTVDLRSTKILCHPDPQIDLAAIDFLPMWQDAKKDGDGLFYFTLNVELIRENITLARELDVMTEVVMAGYPNGQYDRVNNYPILRRGITASHPGIDYDGKPMVAVDIPCFPGSSGSPVMMIVQGFHSPPKAAMAGFHNFTIFLGVLVSGAIMKPDGVIEIDAIPSTKFTMDDRRLIAMNLGFYVKATAVHELVEANLESLTSILQPEAISKNQ